MSFAGISGKSQVLFALVFTTRYLDLFSLYISAYNTVMKVSLETPSAKCTAFLIHFNLNCKLTPSNKGLKKDLLKWSYVEKLINGWLFDRTGLTNKGSFS